jgi:superfamily II DNA/RNA helicase
MSFADLSLHPMVLKALEEGGYTDATPVQAAAIPPALEGRDVLATAATGTGKTAAFLLPALTRIAALPSQRMPGAPRILVLAPTRELASQVTQAVRKYGKYLRLSSVDIVGGMPYRDQLRLLSRPIDVVVATPGRLIDHVQRGKIDLSEVEVLVLDEADRMLDMGFAEDVDFIAQACSADRQTMLFTATLDRRMSGLAERLLKNPVRVAVEHVAAEVLIEQRLHHTDDLEHKRRLLHHFASSPDVGKALVFAATKRDADTLAQDLVQAGHLAAPLHGDMTQAQRNRTLDRLRSGHVRLVVATDVAARGIDVRDISHVINFDLPRVAEDYVHRIGRTGRAGATGVAISFAGRADREALVRIERFTKARLEVHVVPGLEPRPRAAYPAGRPSASARPGAPSGRPWGKSSARPNNNAPRKSHGA